MPEGPQFFASGKLPRQPFRAPKSRGMAQPSKTDLTSSPLSTIFPTTKTFGPVGFQAIKIPLAFQAAANLSNAANMEGILYHCLCDVELATIFGECSIYGAILHLNSVPKTLSAPDRPNEVLWGIPTQITTILNQSVNANNRALIAIGDDKALPLGSVANNRWTFAPVGTLAVPGFADPTIVNVSAEVTDSAGPNFIHYEFFPMGNYWATTCQRATLRPLFSPYVTRFPRGKRLRVSLIITNDNIQPVAEAANDLFVYGGVSVSLLIGEMQTQTPYTADE